MGGPGSGRRRKDADLDRVLAATSGNGPGVTPQAQIPSGTLVPDTTAMQNSAYMARLQGALNKAFLGNNNPMWDDQRELELMASASFDKYSEVSRLLSFLDNSSPNANVGINERFSKRHTVADLNIPTQPLAVIQLSLRYALENPFAAKAIRVKAEFTCKDFKHKTHKKESKDFFDDYALKLKLRSRLPKIVWNLFATGLCPIYWGGEDGGPIRFLQILNPAAVEIIEVMGDLKMFLKVSPEMIAAVRDPKGAQSAANKLQYDSMPKYWIKQLEELIKQGKQTGLISLQDGSYTVVDYRYTPYNRSGNTLDGVPLQGAFDALQRYRLLAAGDFAVAWNVKNMLTLVSEGDPDADQKDYRPADNVRLEKLRQQFAHPDYALTIFCDPTTQVRYIVPPLEVFDPKKYEQVEKEIKEVLNLPSFMWSNDGKGTYGAAQAEVQLLRQEIQAVRLILQEQFFRPLYTRLRMGHNRPGFAQADIVLPSFDQNSLRDDTVWLSSIQEAYSRGAVSLETVMEAFGLDFDYEMEQKKLEHDKYGNTSTGAPGQPVNNSPARPLFEPSQGNLIPTRDKGGNPGNNDSNGVDNKETTRRPRKKPE